MSRLREIYPAGRVTLREVDGLRLVKQYPSSDAKRDWLRREHAAGARPFEVGSFLPASRMPRFADVRAMIDVVAAPSGAWFSALALNERGASDAVATPVDEIVCVVAATEEHSPANMRRSRADAVALVGRTAELARGSAHPPLVMPASPWSSAARPAVRSRRTTCCASPKRTHLHPYHPRNAGRAALYGVLARAGKPPGIALGRLTSNPETEPTGG